MLKFAANLSFLFPSFDFEDRFAIAAANGFTACEYISPYAHEPTEIANLLHAAGLTQALFNLPAGNWQAGERGLAALPGREEEFAASVETALIYAKATNCQKLHIMSGCADASDAECTDTFVSNLQNACKQLEEAGITALIEPINDTDIPEYFLTELSQALRILDRVGAPNLKLQFDCYHHAMMGGDIVTGLDQAGDVIGHVQMADMPGRHEPGTGTLDYNPVFKKLLSMGYEGWIGCEYHPQTTTAEGLGWLQPWL